MQTGYPPIRRVVTGHDANDVAKVLLDEPATNAKYPQPGQVSTLMWCTDGAPAEIPAGDIMIQRGTNHARANRSGQRARVAFVLVDAKPLGIGNPVTGTHSAR